MGSATGGNISGGGNSALLLAPTASDKSGLSAGTGASATANVGIAASTSSSSPMTAMGGAGERLQTARGEVPW